MASFIYLSSNFPIPGVTCITKKPESKPFISIEGNTQNSRKLKSAEVEHTSWNTAEIKNEIITATPCHKEILKKIRNMCLEIR